MKRGTLYLVPTPLDFGVSSDAPLTEALPASTLRTAAGLTHWVAENAKSLRAFLKRVDAVHALPCPMQSMAISELPRAVHKHGDHQGGIDAKPLLAAALLAASDHFPVTLDLPDPPPQPG